MSAISKVNFTDKHKAVNDFIHNFSFWKGIVLISNKESGFFYEKYLAGLEIYYKFLCLGLVIKPKVYQRLLILEIH